MSLTDDEVDVLVVAETLPGFDGAWRLPPPPFPLAHGEVAYRIVVAVRLGDGGSGPRTLGALATLPNAAPVLVFDPASGAPTPLRRALPIALSPFDRARGVARREARALEEQRILAGRWAPRPDPFPSSEPQPSAPPVASIHAERSPCAASNRRCSVVIRTRSTATLVRPIQRVLFVDTEATLVVPLRHRLRFRTRFTHVRSRWEALERLEFQHFDRILVVDRAPSEDASTTTEPSLNRFYRAASALWPHIEPRFSFIVDADRLAGMRGRLADRFLVRELDAITRDLDVGGAVRDPFR